MRRQTANDPDFRPDLKSVIIDASALLALLQDEPGSEKAAEALEQGSISAANLSEVASKLIQAEVPKKEVVSILESFDLEIIPVEAETAFLAASLMTITRQYGLSLGDRICLATAILRGEVAVTADKVWAEVKHKGLDVVVIR